ncbi:hypothetical protein D3C71_2050550 [compost metagenome]
MPIAHRAQAERLHGLVRFAAQRLIHTAAQHQLIAYAVGVELVIGILHDQVAHGAPLAGR